MTPFVGEIRMFGGNFAPLGWAFCDGQLLPISEHDALFNLIGTTYGGDGQETFALPDLQGRVPVHAGTNPTTGFSYVLGERAGVESVTLTVAQIPVHSHPLTAAGAATGTSAASAVPAAVSAGARYFSGTGATVNMDAPAPAGGSQPHDNMAPFVCISFIISLFGVFPSPT
jgi:microcystin-dependent protein